MTDSRVFYVFSRDEWVSHAIIDIIIHRIKGRIMWYVEMGN